MIRFHATPFGPHAARLEWDRIEIQESDLHYYDYIIYYVELGLRRPERSAIVSASRSSTILRNLRGGLAYKFEVAVSRTIGTETYVGERSLPGRAHIERGAGDPPPSSHGGNNITAFFFRITPKFLIL